MESNPRCIDNKFLVLDAPNSEKDKDSVAALHVVCLVTGNHKFVKALNY